MPSPTRRAVLETLLRGAGIAAVGGCASPSPGDAPPPEPPTPSPEPESSPSLPDDLRAEHFVVHNPSPLALEVRRSALGVGAITPVSRFFVRNNLPRPSEAILADRDAWTLAIAGVAEPGTLTLAQLRQLGVETVAAVIQCSGNGRRFFEHGPAGSPWATGAAGCALWTGVRVSRVLEHLGGPVADARFLTGTGGEPLPDGVDHDTAVVERSVPLSKGMADCLLVWEMNGAPLPISHGGPLRLLVPGYFGCNQIKYIRRLAATSTESGSRIQAKGYRFRPIGEGGSPVHPSMWRMPVKSWVNGPGADGVPVLAGSTTFYGVALSGERGIARVEVSLDGGASWVDAELTGPDLGPNAWRTFQHTAELAPGPHSILSRATDRDGDTQPEARVPNERGYGHNGWRDHALSVRVVAELEAAGEPVTPSPTRTTPSPSPTREVELSEAGQRGKRVFREQAEPSCGVCHSLADAGTQGAVGPDLDALKPDAARVRSAVSNGVGSMPAFQSLTAEQIADVAAYVTEATRP